MPSNMVLPSSHARNSSGNLVNFGIGGSGQGTRRQSPVSASLPAPVFRNPRVIRFGVITAALLSLAGFFLLYGSHGGNGRPSFLLGGGDSKLEMEEAAGESTPDGGLVVGANGKFFGTAGASSDTAESSKHADSGPLPPSTSGGQDESSNEYGWPVVEGKGNWPGYTSKLARNLLHGLDPVPPNPTLPEPLSTLGQQADDTYIYGPQTMSEYKHSLKSFIESAFPMNMHHDLKKGMEMYMTVNDTEYYRLASLGGKDGWKNVWMTDKDKNRMANSNSVQTWKNNGDGWGFKFMDDWEMEKWVSSRMKGSMFGLMWDALPLKILKADTLRYLLLCISGGVYTDIDTKLLRSISEWGKDADLWNGGEGWLGEEAARDVRKKWKKLPPPSVVIGVEADVGDREDWHDWWPRPLQIVQWTLGSTPHHPIFIDVLQGIMRATAKAVTWDVSRTALIRKLKDEGRAEEAARVESADVRHEPSEGGPIGVMNWTGPGVWTDAVIRYLRVRYGVQWTDLRNLQKPLRIGEVVVLPVTGFSPNVGLFGAKNSRDLQAMVEHSFAGTWKGQD